MLPVKVWCQSKGMLIPKLPSCIWCGEEETLEHVFVVCRTAFYFWYIWKQVLQIDIDVTWRKLVFLHAEEKSHSIVELAMLLGLHALWCSRSDKQNAALKTRTPLEAFQQKTKWTSGILHHRKDPDERRWGEIEQRIEEELRKERRRTTTARRTTRY